ncbi:MAG: DUF456 domain-containing protein [Deltaproteobacteria bacterium]|nr:DUF456 domain-containing protein [Deltaproteobacteria bacterium]
MTSTIATAAFAILLVIIGVIGTILPALPGSPLVLVGLWILAWQEQFERVSQGTMWFIAALTVLSLVVDVVATQLGAKRAGASALAVLGATIGTFAGIFSGFVGLLFFPFVGAAVGEYIARQNMAQAGRAGMGTWLGLVIGMAAKLALLGLMLGTFAIAYFA